MTIDPSKEILDYWVEIEVTDTIPDTSSAVASVVDDDNSEEDNGTTT